MGEAVSAAFLVIRRRRGAEDRCGRQAAPPHGPAEVSVDERVPWPSSLPQRPQSAQTPLRVSPQECEATSSGSPAQLRAPRSPSEWVMTCRRLIWSARKGHA
jgi:hypothetical protein